jgi:hypothetical protein
MAYGVQSVGFMFTTITELELTNVTGGADQGDLFAHALRKDLNAASGNLPAIQRIMSSPDTGIDLGASAIMRGAWNGK